MSDVNSVTERKIGKVTYIVCSSASENATDTIDKKIKRLIIKDIGQNAEIKENSVKIPT